MLFRFLLGAAGLLLAAIAVGYIVCAIAVPYLSKWNIGRVANDALKASDDESANEILAKTLSGVIRTCKQNGEIFETTLDIFSEDEEEVVASVTVSSDFKDDDLSENFRFTKIAV